MKSNNSEIEASDVKDITATRNDINLKYTPCCLIIFYIVYLLIIKALNLCSANILMGTFMLIFTTKYFLPYAMWYKFDKFMHTKLIKFPKWLKCCVQLNKQNKYCDNDLARSTWESQENGDFDFYTLGHLIMWAVIGYHCELSFIRVLVFSVFWEMVESILGYYDFPCHARTTDIVINSIGFYIGSELFKLWF
jgi:hypothetical protein